MKKLIRTVIADDHLIFIEGLKSVLKHKPIDIVGTASDGISLLSILKELQPQLLILDLNLPGKDGLEVLSSLARQHLPVKVLVLTMYDDPKLVKSCLEAGADGYLLKDKNLNFLFTAIDHVLNGKGFWPENNGIQNVEETTNKEHSNLFKDNFSKKSFLTKRELEILILITQALSNKEIAKTLYISDQTVSVHRKNIMRKLGVSNTAGLIKTAYEHSLV